MRKTTKIRHIGATKSRKANGNIVKNHPHGWLVELKVLFFSVSLKQLYENDPGYVNENVLDYFNDLGNEKNEYLATGSHLNAIRWGADAVPGSERYVELQPGFRLSRWGSETGKYMSDTDTPYDDLELPVSMDKSVQSYYEVIKPFPVKVSIIAVQPWNEGRKIQDSNESALQYSLDSRISVSQLVKCGFLKKVNKSE